MERISNNYHQFLQKRRVINDFISSSRDYKLVDAYNDVKRKQLLNLFMGIMLATFGLGVGVLAVWMVAIFWLVKFRTAEEKLLEHWKETYDVSRSDYLWENTLSTIEKANLILIPLYLAISVPIVGFLYLVFLVLLAGVFTVTLLPIGIIIYIFLAVMKLDNLLIEDIRLIDPDKLKILQIPSKPVTKSVQYISTGKKPISELDQVKSLETLINMSQRIRIDDLAELLQEPRGSLMKKLLYWGKTYPIKIDGDFLVIGKKFQESKDFSDFSSSLMDKLPTCHACGELLETESKYCPSCGEETKICEICKRNINFGDPVAYCPHCGGEEPFHRGHLLETIKMMKKCPRCRKEVTENEVVILEMGKTK
ncbi:MAG: hypothetical protein ACXAEU_12245 [Candidatus Hodarchaeales archaeon]